MKKYKTISRISSIIICLVLTASLLSGCSKAEFTLAKFNEKLAIHTDDQAQALADGCWMIPGHAFGEEELSIPKPVKLTWDITTNEKSELDKFIVQVSENDNMSECWEYETTEKSYDVYNLKIGTKYYWRVVAKYKGGSTFYSQIESIETESVAPRNIYVDGVTNVRDLGGWETTDGGKVKQGLIYRCGRLNQNNSAEKKITDKGIDTMVNYLKIKSEIDLRYDKNNESGNLGYSVLGDTVTYFPCPMGYTEETSEKNDESIRKMFELLSDEKNYPIIFHCSIGTDRTGKLAYLINGLLGVDQDKLFTDYVFSDFGKIGGMRTVNSITSSYVYTLDYEIEGDTLSERIYKYLEGLGVTKDQLDSVIRILKEEPVKE